VQLVFKLHNLTPEEPVSENALKMEH